MRDFWQDQERSTSEKILARRTLQAPNLKVSNLSGSWRLQARAEKLDLAVKRVGPKTKIYLAGTREYSVEHSECSRVNRQGSLNKERSCWRSQKPDFQAEWAWTRNECQEAKIVRIGEVDWTGGANVQFSPKNRSKVQRTEYLGLQRPPDWLSRMQIREL